MAVARRRYAGFPDVAVRNGPCSRGAAAMRGSDRQIPDGCEGSLQPWASRRVKRFGKELLGSHLAIVPRGALQARSTEGRRAFLDSGQHFLAAFREAIEIVDQIDQ
jgi:hypothetical protein